MTFTERAKAYVHLGNSDTIARAVFADYGIDLGKEVARLNNKAIDLAAGDILLAGARAAVDVMIRTERMPTSKGDIRPYVYQANLEPPEAEANLAADLRDSIQEQYRHNGEERRSGDFKHILDCTVSEVTRLAERYRKTAMAHHIIATRYEWLVQQAVERGLGENDTLRKAFTEQEIAEVSIPSEQVLEAEMETLECQSGR